MLEGQIIHVQILLAYTFKYCKNKMIYYRIINSESCGLILTSILYTSEGFGGWLETGWSHTSSESQYSSL